MYTCYVAIISRPFIWVLRKDSKICSGDLDIDLNKNKETKKDGKLHRCTKRIFAKTFRPFPVTPKIIRFNFIFRFKKTNILTPLNAGLFHYFDACSDTYDVTITFFGLCKNHLNLLPNQNKRNIITLIIVKRWVLFVQLFLRRGWTENFTATAK